MTSMFGIRLSDEERALVDEAAVRAVRPGDRGGSSTWARSVLLREARVVVEATKRLRRKR